MEAPGALAVEGRQGGVGDATGRRSMSHVVSEAARELAAQLEQRFTQDAELARRLADAQERLERANERLWWGLHADGLAAVYGEDRAAVEVAFAANRWQVLGAPDPLVAVQQVHWRIRACFIEYQAVAEKRRQLAAGTGEVIRRLVDALMATGWSEEQARNANVHELARSVSELPERIEPHGRPIE
jgi:hypothetical protein